MGVVARARRAHGPAYAGGRHRTAPRARRGSRARGGRPARLGGTRGEAPRVPAGCRRRAARAPRRSLPAPRTHVDDRGRPARGARRVRAALWGPARVAVRPLVRGRARAQTFGRLRSRRGQALRQDPLQRSKGRHGASCPPPRRRDAPPGRGRRASDGRIGPGRGGCVGHLESSPGGRLGRLGSGRPAGSRARGATAGRPGGGRAAVGRDRRSRQRAAGRPRGASRSEPERGRGVGRSGSPRRSPRRARGRRRGRRKLPLPARDTPAGCVAPTPFPRWPRPLRVGRRRRCAPASVPVAPLHSVGRDRRSAAHGMALPRSVPDRNRDAVGRRRASGGARQAARVGDGAEVDRGALVRARRVGRLDASSGGRCSPRSGHRRPSRPRDLRQHDRCAHGDDSAGTASSRPALHHRKGAHGRQDGRDAIPGPPGARQAVLRRAAHRAHPLFDRRPSARSRRGPHPRRRAGGRVRLRTGRGHEGAGLGRGGRARAGPGPRPRRAPEHRRGPQDPGVEPRRRGERRPAQVGVRDR